MAAIIAACSSGHIKSILMLKTGGLNCKIKGTYQTLHKKAGLHLQAGFLMLNSIVHQTTVVSLLRNPNINAITAITSKMCINPPAA